VKKYIFVVGGVMSSVGKGVTSASIACLLKNSGFSVTAVKADPYINVDAGTMNPVEHGEVFVTEDADECDQDIGNYERFLNQNILKSNYMTTGRVYLSVINRERNLEYGGKCVEVVPHIPEEIIRRIENAAKTDKADITIVEIGGTVGEYQNILFLEAARMMKMKNPDDVCFVLVSYLPTPGAVGEMKTKPTQYASRTLNGAGIQADLIVCRGEHELDEPRRQKLATFCGIEKGNAISAPDVKSIYEIPMMFESQQLTEKILKKLKTKPRKADNKVWLETLEKAKNAKKVVNIAIVGKYFGTGSFTLSDSYISVIESAKIACFHQGIMPKFSWIDSEQFEKDNKKISILKDFDGVIVPGGFGSRGIEGIIMTVKYCRENRVPYFGLCYGMQIATIEFARNVAKLKDANTQEINPKTPHPVIHIMDEQKQKIKDRDLGGTMRLGAYDCKLTKDTLAYKAYSKNTDLAKSKDIISERHRHRYEFNNDYRDQLTKLGLIVSGINPQRDLVEIVEIKDHPFFVGVQFHPEFKSRFVAPHPLFSAFVKAAASRRKA
jgi:CTP synthase